MRTLVVIVMALLAWIGASGAPAVAVPTTAVAAYAHDSHRAAAQFDGPECGRGPQATYDRDITTYDTVDLQSRGSSTRLDTSSQPASTIYDHPVLLVQIAGVAASTQGPAQVAGVGISSFGRSRVAANAGDDLTRVGRWMPEDELADMRRTGLVQERSGGRTFVTNPSNPAAYPAGKGVFAEFNVPTKSLVMAGNGPRIHSRYSDGTPVYEGQQPPRLGTARPDPAASGAYSQLRWDASNQRVYQAREFDEFGNPVRDIDFTLPTYPNGVPRPGHVVPEQHRWIVNDPDVGPRSGFRRGPGGPL